LRFTQSRREALHWSFNATKEIQARRRQSELIVLLDEYGKVRKAKHYKIDCGAFQARAELLFFVSLLVGFTDVYRFSAVGTDNFIQLSKPSVSFIEGLATLRIRALKRVADLIKPPAHDALPVGVDGSAPVPGTLRLPSVLRLTIPLSAAISESLRGRANVSRAEAIMADPGSVIPISDAQANAILRGPDFSELNSSLPQKT